MYLQDITSMCWRNIFISLLYLSCFASNLAALETKEELIEDCWLIIANTRDGTTSKKFPSINKISELTQNKGALKFPVALPKGTKTIECIRGTIVPLKNDYKILMSGLKLMINIHEPYQLGMFEVKKGKLNFWMIRGEMTKY